MGDGNTIQIFHIGNTNLLASNKKFRLLNTLYSHYIKNNLLCVSNFFCNNHSYVHWIVSFFLLFEGSKYGAPLFCWQNKDGLYEWSSGSEHHTPQCNVSIPPNLWNRWLGHPNHHTLNMILHQFSLAVYYSRTTSICNFFYSNKMHMLPFFWKFITLSMTFVNNLYWFMGIISCLYWLALKIHMVVHYKIKTRSS